MLSIIVTGGTFDKEYDENRGVLRFRTTHIHDVLRDGRCRVRYSVRELMMVDSSVMTDAHREEVACAVRETESRQIVITHGTDTMAETARYLEVEVPQKTVVLTGAMVPYTFGSSDGTFNLGAAVVAAQALPPGVYVAMNGRVFTADNVRKNRELGEFETLR